MANVAAEALGRVIKVVEQRNAALAVRLVAVLALERQQQVLRLQVGPLLNNGIDGLGRREKRAVDGVSVSLLTMGPRNYPHTRISSERQVGQRGLLWMLPLLLAERTTSSTNAP